MITMRSDNFREKSKEIYDKLMDGYEIQHPTTRNGGDIMRPLRQAIMMMTLVPKIEWTTEDYVRVMRCYKEAIRVCIVSCKSNVEFFRSALMTGEIDEASLHNLDINQGIMSEMMHKISELYITVIPDDKDSFEFHLAAMTGMLHYYNAFAKGSISLKAANADFSEELNAASTFVKERAVPVIVAKLKNRPLASLQGVELMLLLACYRYLSGIYLLEKKYDQGLKCISKMCEAINRLPIPENHYGLDKNFKAFGQFVGMFDAYHHFNKVLAESDQATRYASMKPLLHLAMQALAWETTLTTVDVRALYEDICQQDILASLLQRQFLGHILSSMLDNANHFAMKKNALAIELLAKPELTKEFNTMISHLTPIALVSPTHSPEFFRKGEANNHAKAVGSDRSERVGKQVKY